MLIPREEGLQNITKKKGRKNKYHFNVNVLEYVINVIQCLGPLEVYESSNIRPPHPSELDAADYAMA